ncbi:unnamed protein product [Mytilus coruscus]|uniref:Uncharacterized protein n=1 Tax=Mytilus coruscus TaxID=42192 RepID=A0A6J8AS63_MYTCO|nr:unnamed protein product [Mytilus coruscus]
MKNDILYRKWIHSTTKETILQLIVTNEWKQEILEMLHDDVQSGHLGISKTAARRGVPQPSETYMRITHPRTVLKCNKCPNMLSASLRYRLHKHQTAVHGLRNMDTTEVNIPTLMGGQRAPLKGKKKINHVSETSVKPIENQTEPSIAFSPVKSLTLITLGLDSHPAGTPVLSPLPSTPKKRKLSLSGEKKKDCSHLVLPDKKAAEEVKKWQRCLAPLSLFSKAKVAETIRTVRKEAISSPTYVGSVLPYGYGCVKSEERAITYSPTASWIANPTFTMLQETDKVPVSNKEANTTPFYNAWAIGEKCVDTADLFSTSEITEPESCIPEGTFIDLTVFDSESSSSVHRPIRQIQKQQSQRTQK